MIKKLLFKLLNLTSSQSDLKENINDDYKFLVTLRLDKLRNVFDAEAIWHPDYNEDTPQGELNGSPFYEGLYSAIKSTPHITSGYDEQRNRAVGKHSYFTDVLIYINADKWQLDAFTGASQIYILADRLRALHQSYFKGKLLNKRTPRYCIMPAREEMNLSDKEVIIQFGLSVFIPDEHDKQIAKFVFNHYNRIGYHLDNWVFFDKNGKRIERPAALYENQTCLRFAKPGDLNSCFNVPKWFEQPYEKTILMVSFQQNGFDKGCSHITNSTGIKHAAPTIKGKKGWSYPFFGGRQRIGLDFYPVDYQSRHEIKDIHGNIIGTTYVGMNHAKVENSPDPLVFLSHIALPDPTMLLPNFDQWQLAFNQGGELIDTLTSSETPFIRFFSKDGDIFYQGEEETAEQISNVSSINIDKHTFDILPPPSLTTLSQKTAASLGNVYQNLITLPPEWRKVKLSFPETRTITLGRSVQACHQDLLAKVGTLSLRGKASQQTLHDIYFSREHAELSYEESFISLRQLSTNAPIIVLDKEKQQLATIPPHDDRTLPLESGQAIILGCYVFQVYLPEDNNGVVK